MPTHQNINTILLLLDDYQDLSGLVRENEVDKIKKLINKAQALEGWKWEKSFECALRQALLSGRTEVVSLFLDAGISAEKKIPENADDSPQPLTYFAAKGGHLDLLKLLVQRGATLWLANSPELAAAVYESHLDVVNYLLDEGADPATHEIWGDRKSPGYAVLSRAAMNGREDIVAALMRHSTNGKAMAFALCRENCYHGYVDFPEPEERMKARIKYAAVRKILLDHAVGVDFNQYFPLRFYPGMDVSGVNFIGVSVSGRPVTREWLLSEGYTGVDKALVTIHDMGKCYDANRRARLRERIEALMSKTGCKIGPDGIVNLVPLFSANTAEICRQRQNASIAVPGKKHKDGKVAWLRQHVPCLK